MGLSIVRMNKMDKMEGKGLFPIIPPMDHDSGAVLKEPLVGESPGKGRMARIPLILLILSIPFLGLGVVVCVVRAWGFQFPLSSCGVPHGLGWVIFERGVVFSCAG